MSKVQPFCCKGCQKYSLNQDVKSTPFSNHFQLELFLRCLPGEVGTGSSLEAASVKEEAARTLKIPNSFENQKVFSNLIEKEQYLAHAAHARKSGKIRQSWSLFVLSLSNLETSEITPSPAAIQSLPATLHHRKGSLSQRSFKVLEGSGEAHDAAMQQSICDAAIDLRCCSTSDILHHSRSQVAHLADANAKRICHHTQSSSIADARNNNDLNARLEGIECSFPPPLPP